MRVIKLQTVETVTKLSEQQIQNKDTDGRI